MHSWDELSQCLLCTCELCFDVENPTTGSHAAGQRGDAGGNDSTRNQDEGDEAGGSSGDQDTNDNNAGALRRRFPTVNNNNTNNENDNDDVTAVKTAINPAMAMADLIRNANGNC